MEVKVEQVMPRQWRRRHYSTLPSSAMEEEIEHKQGKGGHGHHDEQHQRQLQLGNVDERGGVQQEQGTPDDELGATWVDQVSQSRSVSCIRALCLGWVPNSEQNACNPSLCLAASGMVLLSDTVNWVLDSLQCFVIGVRKLDGPKRNLTSSRGCEHLLKVFMCKRRFERKECSSHN
eukprot:1159355-Pelagomonas_calceolata.AAC.4